MTWLDLIARDWTSLLLQCPISYRMLKFVAVLLQCPVTWHNYPNHRDGTKTVSTKMKTMSESVTFKAETKTKPITFKSKPLGLKTKKRPRQWKYCLETVSKRYSVSVSRFPITRRQHWLSLIDAVPDGQKACTTSPPAGNNSESWVLHLINFQRVSSDVWTHVTDGVAQLSNNQQEYLGVRLGVYGLLSSKHQYTAWILLSQESIPVCHCPLKKWKYVSINARWHT